MVTIRLRRNGPYVVEGDEVQVVDWRGIPYPPGRLPLALCRCGASASRPFCDGSHARVGFDADERGVPVPGAGAGPKT